MAFPAQNLAASLVLPGEDNTALEQLSASYHQRYNPQGPDEIFLVDSIVHADWTIRRLERLEAQVFTALITKLENSDNPLADAFEQDLKGAGALQKIFRRQEAAKKEWHRAVASLRQLQRERQPAERTQFPDLHTMPVRNEPNFPPQPAPELPAPPRRPPVDKKFWRR